MRRLLTKLQLCQEVLNVSPEWFAHSRNRKRLKDQGFPEPVPGMGKRWDSRAIAAWLDKVGNLNTAPIAGEPTITITLPDPAAPDIADAQRILLMRLGQNQGANH